ncbi:glycosyltransferase [Hankyongella ginsenosidimutans]
MSYGTPVVSYATGGIPEIVDHGRDGLLVPPKDTVEMAAAILRLLRDRKRLHPTD